MVNAIASERKRIGMSQDDLGQKVGKRRGTIARWESDPTVITGKYLCELSSIFGCSIDYLLGLTEERTPKAVS